METERQQYLERAPYDGMDTLGSGIVTEPEADNNDLYQWLKDEYDAGHFDTPEASDREFTRPWREVDFTY